MPIKGLSDRDSVDPRFKEIGRLRKGAVKSGNRPGKDLEYFRFVPDNGRADIAEAFRKAYGDKPDHLEVLFPFDRMERVFGSYREDYGANNLCKLRCDGENWIDWIDGDRHYHVAEGRPCEFKFKDVDNRCPACPCGYYGRMSVILPELWHAGHIGLVLVLTTSVNDIAFLSSKLVQWEPLTRRPFMLWRDYRRIGVPIKGKRAGVDKSLLHLELKEEEMERLFLSAGPDRPMLAESNEPEDAEIIDATDDEPPLDYDDEPTGDLFLNGDPGHAADIAEAKREIEHQEDESKPTAHQWTLAEADTLFKWTRNELVITDADALIALGVKRMSEYVSDPAQARATISAWVAEQTKAEPA